MNQIGFVKNLSDWTGPVEFPFQLLKEHSKVTRYKHQVKNRQFDFYAPAFLLNQISDQNLPNEIVVEIGKSFEPTKEIGYKGNYRKPKLNPDYFEYEFSEEMEWSVKYEFKYEGNNYSIYIPKVVFETNAFPTRVYAGIRLK